MEKQVDPMLLFSISLLVIYKTIITKPRCGYIFYREEKILLFLKMAAQFLRGFKEIYTMKIGYKAQKKIQ
jgi:hypothetical protein